MYDISDKTTCMFQGVASTTPLLHIWFKIFLYLLKYALNLALGFWYYINKTGAPRPLLQRSPL